MCSEFGKVLERVEHEWDVMMEVFRFMPVRNGDFDNVCVLAVTAEGGIDGLPLHYWPHGGVCRMKTGHGIYRRRMLFRSWTALIPESDTRNRSLSSSLSGHCTLYLVPPQVYRRSQCAEIRSLGGEQAHSPFCECHRIE